MVYVKIENEEDVYKNLEITDNTRKVMKTKFNEK
jgi:hypothetical protein